MGPEIAMELWSFIWILIAFFMTGLLGYVLILSIKALKKYLREDDQIKS